MQLGGHLSEGIPTLLLGAIRVWVKIQPPGYGPQVLETMFPFIPLWVWRVAKSISHHRSETLVSDSIPL